MIGWALLVSCCLVGSAAPAHADDQEALFFMEIPLVVSSSKRPQPMEETASSVMVMSGEEIRRSGATNIAAALRALAGVDVRQAHASQHVLGIRGFADTGHVLVTIDGNNAFMYHANHIFLDWAPLNIEEVERVEVIKGPGGLFYGGSAFSGVINIVTREDVEGTYLTIQGGNGEAYRGNVIHGGNIGEQWDYSIALGARGAREWDEPELAETVGYPGRLEGERFRVFYGAGRLARSLGGNALLTLDLRYSNARNVISRVCNPTTRFANLRYEREDFWLRLFHNFHVKDFWDETYGVDDRNYELELMKLFRRGAHTLSVGGYAKYTWWEVSRLQTETRPGIAENHAVADLAVNLEDEWRLGERYILSIGGRLERYTDLDYMTLGRASVIFKPDAGRHLRFTAATGHYLPSLFQQTNEGTAYPFALGNRDLKEERIAMFELAGAMEFSPGMRMSGALFYNICRDLIDNSQSGPMQNVADADQLGMECQLECRFSRTLSGSFGYAFLDTERDDYAGTAVDPRHKANWGLALERDGRMLALRGQYVGAYQEIYMTANPVFGRVGDGVAEVDGYFTVDAHLVVAAGEGVEVGMSVANLFANEHFESNAPPDGWHTADAVARRMNVTVNYAIH